MKRARAKAKSIRFLRPIFGVHFGSLTSQLAGVDCENKKREKGGDRENGLNE